MGKTFEKWADPVLRAQRTIDKQTQTVLRAALNPGVRLDACGVVDQNPELFDLVSAAQHLRELKVAASTLARQSKALDRKRARR